MSKKGSKNDAKNRNSRAALRLFNGQEVEPVMFCCNEKGKYIAARYKDKTKGEGLIVVNGSPIPYNRCQKAA